MRLEAYATSSVPPLGRRFSWATKLTYRIPATHPLQYKKSLVNSNKIDLTLVSPVQIALTAAVALRNCLLVKFCCWAMACQYRTNIISCISLTVAMTRRPSSCRFVDLLNAEACLIGSANSRTIRYIGASSMSPGRI